MGKPGDPHHSTRGLKTRHTHRYAVQSTPETQAEQQDPGALNAATNQQAPNFHGAAVIDEQGQEVPITEAMIDQALKSLDL